MVAASERLYVISVVAAYWVVSISMVYLNKMLLSNEERSIAAPLFVTWYQCLLTCFICYILGELGEQRRTSGQQSFLNQFPRVKYNVTVGMSVLPLSLIFVGMITFNNLCLQYVAVSFCECITSSHCDNSTVHAASLTPLTVDNGQRGTYTHSRIVHVIFACVTTTPQPDLLITDNVARSLSIVFNVIFTFTILGESTSMLTCSTLLVVILGFYMGIEGELDFSLVGTIAGVLSSVFVSLNSIFTAKVLPKVNGDKSHLLYYNNFNATLLFIPLIFLFETQVKRICVSRLLKLGIS